MHRHPPRQPPYGPGIKAMQAASAFMLCWFLLTVVLTLVTLRLPLLFTNLLVLVNSAFGLSYLAYQGTAPSTGLLTVAGIVTVGYTLIGVYLFYDAMNQALGGRALPAGSPLIR